MEYDARFLTRAGKVIACHLHVTMVAWNGCTAAMAIFEDRTDRLSAETEWRRLASTDPLTELDNRRHFLERMAEALSRLHRDPDQPAALLVLDVDHFKSINDRHGHAAGDAALRFLSGLLRGELRREDTAGRIGGEEFAILLPGSDLAAATVFADRLRRTIAAAQVTFAGQALAVTVSIGVTALKTMDTTPEQALARADAALYRAKDAGRNRIEPAVDPATAGMPTGAHRSKDAPGPEADG